ncbi:hypothetical protein ACPRNU_09475 [Chromobacterium vaccinii]|uniref:hypothetical protein n=1 Tax=Chromobacterium vaccinii TaxID=1108595 RepID=UPI003C794172
MHVLSLDEVEMCSGGKHMSENQCIGIFSTAGGALGAWAGFYAGGVGALAGASFGMGVGGTAGMLLCAELVPQ